MKKRPAAAIIALFLAPRLALAQTSQIESGLSRAVPVAIGIGMAISTIGLVFSGIKFSSGDPMAKEHAKNVAIGSVLIMSASALMGLFRQWFT
jgi:hypothetical protein